MPSQLFPSKVAIEIDSVAFMALEELAALRKSSVGDVLEGFILSACTGLHVEMRRSWRNEARLNCFIDKREGNGPDGSCWLWKGNLARNGYARFKMGKSYVSVHRLMYMKTFGAVPDGLILDHLCRVRNCVNPAHLEAVTPAENVRRGDSGKWQKSKTHCPAGHLYSEDNVYSYKARRHCRECKRLRSIAKNQKLKQLRKEILNGR